MIEFIFSIPLLALVIAATFFFGMVMKHQLRFRQADRYVSWRQVHNSEAGADGSNYAYIHYGEPDEQEERDEFIESYGEANVVEITDDLINTRFLSLEGEDVRVDKWGGRPVQTLEDLVTAAADQSERTGELADRCIFGTDGDGFWPQGSVAQTDASFPNEVRALHRIESLLQSQSSATRRSPGSRRTARDGMFWRRGQNSYVDPIRELFLYELDDATQNINDSQLRDNVENLYTEHW